MQFLFLYWTYPTVIDIQQISPSYLEIPAFTFCSRSGYIYENFCTEFKFNPCQTKNSMIFRLAKTYVCEAFRVTPCVNGTDGLTPPEGFKLLFWGKFMEKQELTTDDFRKIYVPLEEYLNCSILFAGGSRKCNMDYVLGSFYSTDVLPQFCFTIYSKWGNPNKTRELISKGATMKLNFFLNLSRQPEDAPHASFFEPGAPGPLMNPPNDASLQMAVHSPYFLPSPYLDGYTFLGGRNYELRITLSERHLLPLPYQTNCTDYMTPWRERGGRAPINQLGVIQECRVNETYKALGCIPVTIDYPHNYNLCRKCPDEVYKPCPYKEPPNNCSMLADDYNQPCKSLTYNVEREQKAIIIFQGIDNKWAEQNDGFRLAIPQHDCDGNKLWRKECSQIEIDIPFDRFEITNMTYNAKFESLELFSVIGGYLGMWLGFSLMSAFQMLESAIKVLRKYLVTRKKTDVRAFDTHHHNAHHHNRKRIFNKSSRFLINSEDNEMF